MYSNMVHTIIDHLKEHIEPDAIILFGSIVTHSFRKDSDVDIAILSEKNINKYDLFVTAQQLASKLNREVDLIDIKKASTVFKAQIFGKGKLIYTKDDYRLAEFRIRVFKEYVLLNEERAVIMDAIAKRGGVYGG